MQSDWFDAAAEAVMFRELGIHDTRGQGLASPEEIDSIIEAALAEMPVKGVTGKDAPPFLLSRVAEVTKGRSLAANIQLVYSNAKLAAQIASEFSCLCAGARE